MLTDSALDKVLSGRGDTTQNIQYSVLLTINRFSSLLRLTVSRICSYVVGDPVVIFQNLAARSVVAQSADMIHLTSYPQEPRLN